MAPRRVLVVHHTLTPPAAGGSVAAWTVQALSERDEVTLLTCSSPDLRRVDAAYGTSLGTRRLRVVPMPKAIAMAVGARPRSLELLANNLLFREARRLIRAGNYDAVVGTMNEIDVGTRAVQYIHFPWAFFPRPGVQYPWFRRIPPLSWYRAGCERVSGYSSTQVSANLTIANSNWTGRLFKECYGTQARTIYPPVPADPIARPREARERGFVFIGRVSPEKEIPKVVEIIRRVRARGHAVSLYLAGAFVDAVHVRDVRRLIEPDGEWITLKPAASRAELAARVAQHRYAIHGMAERYFDIAPAELIQGGCVTFVPRDPMSEEIVGDDPRYCYESVDDAVEQIHRMLSDARLEAAIWADQRVSQRDWSAARFMKEMVAAVSHLEDGRTPEE